MIPGGRDPWATVHTKRTAGVDLTLNGPKDAFAVGRIADLGAQRVIRSEGENRDQVKIRFASLDDLEEGDLADFLAEHLAAVSGESASATGS